LERKNMRETSSGNKHVVSIGLEPELADYSAHPGLTPQMVRTQLAADIATLNDMGFDAELCLVDLGDTAEADVIQALSARPVDCVVIGAGVRTYPQHLLLFETLINLVRVHAPAAKICFNTRPDDTTDAVCRWM
jgi:hypothetical protein